MFNKRDFITAAIALAASSTANAQTAKPDTRTPQRKIARGMMKTTRMFKSPPGFSNGMAVTSEGLWLAQQKVSGESAKRYGLPEPTDLREAAWLVDWKLFQWLRFIINNLNNGKLTMCFQQKNNGVR